MKMSLKTILKKTIVGLFFCVVITLIIVWLNVPFFSEKLIFQPVELPPQYQYHFDQNFEEINLNPEPYVLINALYFKAQNAKGIIIYFHGNRDNLQRWGGIASTLTQYNYDVFVMDYRGYGKSTGERTEEKLYQDALFCYDFIQKTYNPKEIIFYGRSLGSGIAAWLSSQKPPSKLILETPYYSVSDLADFHVPFVSISHKLRYKLSSFEYLKNAHFPTLLLHGTNDKLVPFSSCQKLFDAIPEGRKQFVIFEGAGHGNLKDYPLYWSSVRDFLSDNK